MPSTLNVKTAVQRKGHIASEIFCRQTGAFFEYDVCSNLTE
ncbi:hypothetical protein RRSWK_00354 [Rhodopirellula sp. SWK7]|nr:hypothetical protein RRSWK_00354 [Rhodopirellula sp. SWK7]